MNQREEGALVFHDSPPLVIHKKPIERRLQTNPNPKRDQEEKEGVLCWLQ
jgi:hypothetical protein